MLDSGGSGIGCGEKVGVGAAAGGWGENPGDNSGDMVGIAVGAVQGYDSGVPGTDTTNGSGGSMTLGDYVPVICRI